PLRLLSPPDPLRWAPAGAPCGKRFDARSAQSVFPTYTPPEKRFDFLPPPPGGVPARGRPHPYGSTAADGCARTLRGFLINCEEAFPGKPPLLTALTAPA